MPWGHRTGDLPWVDPTDEGREVKKQRTVGKTMATRRDTRVGGQRAEFPTEELKNREETILSDNLEPNADTRNKNLRPESEGDRSVIPDKNNLGSILQAVGKY